jgi:GT2 family glycosyltransferase
VRSLFRENKKVIPRAEVMSAHTFTPENIPAEDYRKWQQHHWLSPERMAKSVLAVTCLSRTPTISIIVTMYNSSEIFLRKALNSVAEQTYTHWELILVDDGSFSPLPEKIAQEFAALYPHKVVFRRLPVRGGISTATNAGAALAKGEYLAFLDHDDLLELDALEKIASFIQNSPVPPDALYTDDDLIDEEDWRYAPAFKPDWSPELLLSFCYVGHWKIVRRTLFLEMQGYRSPFDGAQDYDFFLRLSEKTDRIAHVPKILYHWRNVPQSASKNPVSLERGRKAVDEALQRRSGCASAQYIEDAEDAGLGIYRVAFTPSTTTPVTIIIPTKGKGKLLQRCIQSIRQTTPSIPFTFLIVDNGISDTATLKFLQEESLNVINIDTPQFNFSRLINAAVNQAPTELLLFLNDDTEVITPTWLEEMTGVLRMDTRIGAVGAKLLYPDHSIQHGGVSLLETTAANTNKYLHGNAWGYRYSNRVLRNCAAVTAACMLTRKSCFQEVEGFDEQYFPVGYNDVDYCLKLREKGYRTVWTPHAVLLHHESATRPKYSPDDRSHLALQEKWPALLRNDPYMNPHFSRKTEQFVLMTHT